jgi:hypothetical protein
MEGIMKQYIGIDVSKDRLDVAVGDSAPCFSVENTENGIEGLVKQMKALEPELIVMEATGGYEETQNWLRLRRVMIANLWTSFDLGSYLHSDRQVPGSRHSGEYQIWRFGINSKSEQNHELVISYFGYVASLSC